jgi:hypothetical protein
MLPFYENIIRKMEAQVIFLNLFTVCIIFYGHICAFLNPSWPLHGHQFATAEKYFLRLISGTWPSPRPSCNPAASMFARECLLFIDRLSSYGAATHRASTVHTDTIQYIFMYRRQRIGLEKQNWKVG